MLVSPQVSRCLFAAAVAPSLILAARFMRIMVLLLGVGG
jgi:hypothetical protein